MRGKAEVAAPTGQKKKAQGKARSNAVRGNQSTIPTKPVSVKSRPNGTLIFETGEDLLAHILTKRPSSWQGSGQYKEPIPPDVTKCAELPNGWTWATFDQISALITKGSSPNWQGFNYCENGIKFVRSENVRWGTLDVSDVAHLPAAFNEKEKKSILREGDVLLNLVGASIGRAAIATVEVDGGNVNQAVAVIRLVSKTITNQFAMFWLNSVDGQKQIHAEKVDVARANFSLDDTRRLTLPFPSLSEQARIIAEIEKQFTRLEAGVAALRRVQANLKRYRAAVLKAACEGRLVPTEAELAKSGKRKGKFETGKELLARILKERRKNWRGRGQFKEPEAADTTNLPHLPDGWAWTLVEQLASPDPNSITDGPFGSNLKTEHYTEAGPRVIRLQNIGDGVYLDEEAHISQVHYERLQKHRVFADDVVIAGFGENPPRSCVIPNSLGPAIVKADCIRFKPHASILSKYVNAALNSDPVRKRTKGLVHGVGRPRLNLGEIRSIVLPIPPLAEQTRIVAEVERRLSVVEELEAVVAANLQRAARLRQAILQKAFTGGGYW